MQTVIPSKINFPEYTRDTTLNLSLLNADHAKTRRIKGIPFILHNGYVDYGIIHTESWVYIVRPKRLFNGQYKVISRQIKPGTLYSALRRNNHTILSITDSYYTDIF